MVGSSSAPLERYRSGKRAKPGMAPRAGESSAGCSPSGCVSMCRRKRLDSLPAAADAFRESIRTAWGDSPAMAEVRFQSVLTLLRILTGAEPILRTQPALSNALDRLNSARDPRDIARLDRMIWRMWSSAGTREAVRNFIRALQALARN